MRIMGQELKLAWKKIKDHFIRHKKLLEDVIVKRYLREDGGII